MSAPTLAPATAPSDLGAAGATDGARAPGPCASAEAEAETKNARPDAGAAGQGPPQAECDAAAAEVKAGEVRAPNGLCYNPDVALCRRALALGHCFCPTTVLAAAAAGDAPFVAWARTVGQPDERYYARKGLPLPPPSRDPEVRAGKGHMPWLGFLAPLAQVRDPARLAALMDLLWRDTGDGKHATAAEALPASDWHEFLACAALNANHAALDWCVRHAGGAGLLRVPLPPLDVVDAVAEMLARPEYPRPCAKTQAALVALRARVLAGPLDLPV